VLGVFFLFVFNVFGSLTSDVAERLLVNTNASVAVVLHLHVDKVGVAVTGRRHGRRSQKLCIAVLVAQHDDALSLHSPSCEWYESWHARGEVRFLFFYLQTHKILNQNMISFFIINSKFIPPTPKEYESDLKERPLQQVPLKFKGGGLKKTSPFAYEILLDEDEE